MRQRASLDIIADDRPVILNLQDEPEADAEVADRAPEDSRSTSSSSSPVPADNEESDFFLVGNDSESSLGVPNLQDMQVNDDECLPPVNRLPNEILIAIFVRLSSAADILHVMLTCKRWARNSVDILWHRPACTSWAKHSSICQTLGVENPFFSYRDFIKRLNLASLNEKVNDGSVMPLAVCSRVERLTLTGCKGLTDTGLIALVQNNSHLLALDISLDSQITEASINAIAENCRRLQGLNVSGCTKISNESMIKLAQNCRFIKRLKLNECHQLNDDAVVAFAENCPNILEIDLHQCRLVGNEPVTRLLAKGQSLRELRLAGCDVIDDAAFLSLPVNRTYEHLRILDLTSCSELTDRAVEKIIDVAPRLRNLVLAKCRRITDAAVYSIARLGKNLHYVHLGHCGHITDDAVKRLVQACNRIRYIDLGCCIHLTDESVTKLATLPKLKRIGLVKCANITDESVLALARANQRPRPRKDADGNIIPGETYHSSSHSSLERVHLSYCTNLTLQSILRLLNSCPRLTHLSLTGVQAFLREDLEQYCRDAPPEFTEHQRSVFCVFSGQGVVGLRKYLNNERAFVDTRIPPPPPGDHGHPHPGLDLAGVGLVDAVMVHGHPTDEGFFEAEADGVEDDDVLEDGSEMIIDTQPLLNNHNVGPSASTAPLTGNPVSPPVPPHLVPLPPISAAQVQAANPNMFNYVGGHPPYVPQNFRFDDAAALAQPPTSAQPPQNGGPDSEFMDVPVDVLSPRPSAAASGSAAPPRSQQASVAGPSSAGVGGDGGGAASYAASHARNPDN